MYNLVFEKRALDELNKLEKDIKQRIWNKLQDCKFNPFRFLERLTEIDYFKLRVGDYRIIIDVDNERRILNIVKVGHRKNIYER